ncbi:MAG: hypothetical protein OEY56_12700 [Cyclobacteriaceae bacterium]|nr:hypothetical protein [Cyclobacteriaceae bacterium]
MRHDILQSHESNINHWLYVNRMPDFQKSVLEIQAGDVYVDVNGNLVNPQNLSVSGYWSWERMADLVPGDYDPSNNNERNE